MTGERDIINGGDEKVMEVSLRGENQPQILRGGKSGIELRPNSQPQT